jgi:prolyl 4-hydroxylase
MSDTSVFEAATERTQPTREEAFEQLVAWAAERHAEGHSPAQLYNLVREVGWPPEDAASALLRVLPQALQAEVAQLSRGAPDPDFNASPSVVTIDGHAVQVLCDMRHPRLVVFGNLLSPEECAVLIERASGRLERSAVTDDGTESKQSEARTSSGVFFERGETALLARIESRIAALLDWPVHCSEDLHVLRYGKDQQYEPHHDYFEPAEGAWAPVFRRGGQRVASLVIYLNTPPRGGSTVFPDVPIEVRAVQGNAVFFAYETAAASSRTLHGGAPVIEGEKWAAVKWFRQGRFE